jgi:ArsR family transcriptional regulator, arsenate/arsenite/antimonite-responsive transcriptional repressor
MSMCSCISSPKNDKEYRKVASLSKLLQLVGESNRLRILCVLRHGEHCVCEINDQIKASQSLISHNLKSLKQFGLIEDRKKGQNVFYSMTPEGTRISDLIFQIQDEGKSSK